MPRDEYCEIFPNAKVTSDLQFLLMYDLSDTSSATVPDEEQIHRLFSERVTQWSPQHVYAPCRRIPDPKSAHPYHFALNLEFVSQKGKIFVNKFKGHYSTLAYWRGEIKHDITPAITETPFLVEGPSDNVWTVQSWVIDACTECDSSFEDELITARNDLMELLSDFKKAQPLNRPPDMVKLAEKVVGELSCPESEDIQVWADTLSDNLSKFTD